MSDKRENEGVAVAITLRPQQVARMLSQRAYYRAKQVEYEWLPGMYQAHIIMKAKAEAAELYLSIAGIEYE